MAEYIPPIQQQETILESSIPRTNTDNGKLLEWKIYDMWYSSYCSHLYSMLYIEQAYKMCKNGTTIKDNITPKDVDGEVIKKMRDHQNAYNIILKNNANSKETIKNTSQQQIQQPPPTVPLTLRITGYKTSRPKFIYRLIAGIIDHLFVLFLMTLMTDINNQIWYKELYHECLQLLTEFNQVVKDDEETLWITLMIILISILSFFFQILTFFYELVFVTFTGSTIGKLITGLRVVACTDLILQQDDIIIVKSGLKLSFKSAVKRTFLKNSFHYFIPLIVCFINTRGGRTLYDEMAKSAVVHKRELWEPVYI